MRLLLDSHALIWAIEEPEKMSTGAKAAMNDLRYRRCVSAATIWELAIKVSVNKLRLSQPFKAWIATALDGLKAELIPILPNHVEFVSRLPFHHRDPFDRMLIAQSIVEQIPLISCDEKFAAYGVQTIW